MELVHESAPVLLMAFAAAGLLHAFLPKGSVAWLGRGSALSQSTRGVLFGLPLPICSCGVVPIYRSLAGQGMPVAAGMSFLVATPEIGIDAIVLSFKFLGSEIAIARVAAVAVVSITIGILASRWRSKAPATALVSTESTPRSFDDRIRDACRAGFREMVDLTGPWILLGLVLAALCEPLLDPGLFESWGVLQVPIFALIGLPTYVCASGATPLIAVFLAKGATPGAALAFLLTGPASNVTTFGVLARLHGVRFAASFAVAMAALAIAVGYAVDALLPNVSVPDLFTHDHAHGGVEWVFVGGLALLGLISLFRQGPRAFIGQVLTQAVGDHDHDHDHGHGHQHGHDHGHAHEHRH